MTTDAPIPPAVWISAALDGRAIARPATRPPCDRPCCVHAEAVRVRAQLDGVMDRAIDGLGLR